jgi:hypothetical protein
MNSAFAQAAQILDPTESTPRTISKCEHGVYIPQGETRAPYCQLCSPDGPKQTRDVVLPRNTSVALGQDEGRVYANKTRSGGCPECGSFIYLRQKETGTDAQRECADCGHHYVSRYAAARAAIMEAMEEC